MVRRYAGFEIEDLSLRGLMRIRMVKSFADVGSGDCLMLGYKVVLAGREQRQMHALRSTRGCPDCVLIGPTLLLSVRTWRCVGCGAEHDCDIAAAKSRVGLLRYRRRCGNRPGALGENEALPCVAGSEHTLRLVKPGHFE